MRIVVLVTATLIFAVGPAQAQFGQGAAVKPLSLV